MEDDRMPDGVRVELRPSKKLLKSLLEEGYPHDDFPEVQSAQDAFVRAAADIVRHRRHGGMPPDIFNVLRGSALELDGFLPLFLSHGGDALIQPGDNGGIRISTVRDAAQETEVGETAVMEFTGLSDEELDAETKHLDVEDLSECLLRLAEINPDVSVAPLLASTWHASDVKLDELLEGILDAGDVDTGELRAAMEAVCDGQHLD